MVSFFKSTVFVIVLIYNSTAFCQIVQKTKDHNVVQGTIIRDGNKVEGYIVKMGREKIPFSMSETTHNAPWSFQKEILFIEKLKFESLAKVKYKDYEKLTPKEIDGYTYNNDSLVYESLKYGDLNSVGTGMIPKQLFLRKVFKSTISVYIHYTPPPLNGPEEKQIADFKESEKANLVYHNKTGNSNAKGISLINIQKELADCPKVVENYKKGNYKSRGLEKQGEYAEYLLNASEQDIARLYAIAEYNRKNCD
jgi:hypothetical protein